MIRKSLILLSALVFVAAGCDTMGPRTKTGAVGGGVLGATAGGIIGHQTHRGLEGAAIGGALGALAGSVMGSAADQQATPPPPSTVIYQPEPISINQIAQMGNQGTPDSVIISEIQRTHAVFHLNSELIGYLKQNRVSDRVIDYMMGTGN